MIRSMRPSDRAFVASSWLCSYRDATLMSLDDSKRYMSPLVDGLLDSGSVYVACNPDDEGHIFGWLCRDKAIETGTNTLHYMYVKALFRDRNKTQPPRIAKQLLSAAGLMHRTNWRYTFTTPAWERYMEKYEIQADHDKGMLATMQALVRRTPKETNG